MAHLALRCSDEWCYVEDGCNVAHSPSGFVVNANLSYSYARCGALRHFHTRETLRRFSRGTPLPEPPRSP